MRLKLKVCFLWGGVNEEGEIVLEPAFAVDASPSLPQQGGTIQDKQGKILNGRTLFDLTFDMAEIADGGGGSFAYILPIQSGWSERLNVISLSGPEGITTLGDEGSEDYGDAPSAALLLDPFTGEMRGLLRDWPGFIATGQSARRIVPEPGLKFVTSRGIPDLVDW